MSAVMQWDVFCRVIDNYGDIGVCWRLCADLASRGQRVRLWSDDLQALQWMAAGSVASVECRAWTSTTTRDVPGDVVIEAFGCEPPADFVARMASAARPPVWINLEYLSAESYVRRSHRLPSPQMSGPGAGLTKWFFYPGFESGTGGLIREAGLERRLNAVDAEVVLARLGVTRMPGERLVSLFCYRHAPVRQLLDQLAGQPTLLLVTPGQASEAIANHDSLTGGVRIAHLPYQTQHGYDELLAACDLNVVRGEDSFVRAQWAARPFLWHIYAQDDGAHLQKLQAYLDVFLAGAPPALALVLRQAFLAWNGAAPMARSVPDLAAWQRWAEDWRELLMQQQDLISQLIGFVKELR